MPEKRKTSKNRKAARPEGKASAAKASRPNGKEFDLYYYFSVVIHPVFFAVFVLLSFFLRPTMASQLPHAAELIFGIIAFAVIPFSIIYKSWKNNEISLDLEEREKRTQFFLPWAVIFAVAFAFYAHFNALSHAALALCFATIMLVLFFANHYSKISWHTTGLSALITALCFSYGTPNELLYLLLLPTVSLARYKLKAHTLFQLAAGALLGAIICLASYAILGAPQA